MGAALNNMLTVTIIIKPDHFTYNVNNILTVIIIIIPDYYT